MTFFFPRCELIKGGRLNAIQLCVKITRLISSAESKTVMMQDTPTTFMDCAAVFKAGNTQSRVYTLTLPNTTTEVKVQ